MLKPNRLISAVYTVNSMKKQTKKINAQTEKKSTHPSQRLECKTKGTNINRVSLFAKSSQRCHRHIQGDEYQTQTGFTSNKNTKLSLQQVKSLFCAMFCLNFQTFNVCN